MNARGGDPLDPLQPAGRVGITPADLPPRPTPDNKNITAMAKTSIHIKPANLGRGGLGSTNAEGHAYRESWYLKAIAKYPAAGSHFELIERDPDNRNQVSVNFKKYPNGLTGLLERDKAEAAAHSKSGKAPSMKERTRVNPKTGRTYTVAGWSPIREAVVVCKPETDVIDFVPLIQWFQAHGIGVVGLAIHRDEGHTDPRTGEVVINNHAHLFLDYMNHATGKTIKLPDEAMSEMQDVCAKALGMERGESKEKTSRRHLDANAYRAQAQAAELARLQAESEAAIIEAEKARDEAAAIRRQAAQGLGAKAAALFGAGDLAKARKRAEEAEARAEAERKAKEAAISAANAERDKARAEARKAVESAKKAQSAANSAKVAHSAALETLEADKAAAREEGRKAGAAEKDREWRQWYQKTGLPAIVERDKLRKEVQELTKRQGEWLQDFKDIASTLIGCYTADAVKGFEEVGLRDLVGQDLWDEAKKPQKAKEQKQNNRGPHL